MKKYALVRTLGALAGVISCGSGMTAEEMRSSGRIPLPPTVAAPAAQSRVESCLDMGSKRLGRLTVSAKVATLDLSTLSCDDCRVSLSIVVPEGWVLPEAPPGSPAPPIGTLRVGYVYGILTLRSPSDSVLEKIHDLCGEWARDPSYAPACYWTNERADLWTSGLFAARILNGEPYFAHIRLDAPMGTGEHRPVSQLPTFAEPLEIQVDTGFAPILAAVFSFSGCLGFVPQVVEVVDPNESKVLGCLPVHS